MITTDLNTFYSNMGIDSWLLELSKKTENDLRDRFHNIDKTAEYNQLKILKAMQDNRVSDFILLQQTDTDIMISAEILWKKFMPNVFHAERRIGKTTAD